MSSHRIRPSVCALLLAGAMAPAAFAGEPVKQDETKQLKTYSVGGKSTPKAEASVAPVEKPKLDAGIELDKPGAMKLDLVPFTVTPVAPAATKPAAAPAKPVAQPASKPAPTTAPGTGTVAPAKPNAIGAPAGGTGSTGALPVPAAPPRTTPPQGGAVTPAAGASAPTQSLTLVALSTPPPEYPREAAANGTQGYVVVEFTINAEGGTQDISVAESSPRGVFDQAARRAVARWKFQPLLENGQPVEKRVQRRMDFKL